MSRLPQPDRATSILFVCLGNICRSPLAKAVFIHLADQRGVVHQFDIDSCGTGGWHAGAPADPRAATVAAKYGIALKHIARPLNAAHDFPRFQYLVAMDGRNAQDLIAAGAESGRVYLMRSFAVPRPGAAPHQLDVPDPYYGGGEGFERVYEMLVESAKGLLDQLLVGPPRR